MNKLFYGDNIEVSRARSASVAQMSTLEERTNPGLHAALSESLRGLALTPNDRILDIACGTGAWLKRLHAEGYRDLWGTDRDAANFAASDVAHFIAADLDKEVALPTGCSLVTLIEIIEHVDNPYRLIEISTNALRSGGQLLITSPNIYSLRSRVRFLISSRVTAFERSSKTPIEEDHVHPVILEAYKRKIFDPLNLSVERVWTYPDQGSHGSRWFARLAVNVMRLAFSDELPGDNLCLLLRKP